MRALFVLAFSLTATLASGSDLQCRRLFETELSRQEIVKVINAVTTHEIQDVSRLRDTTFEKGFELGLSRTEVDDLLEKFTSLGAIGGKWQALSLFESVSVLGTMDAQHAAHWGTRRELREQFASYMAPQNHRYLVQSKAKRMVDWIVDRASKNPYDADLKSLGEVLRDERHKALLSLWFEASMKPMMQAAIDAAPSGFARAMTVVPRVVEQNAKWASIIGIVGSIKLLHPGLLIDTEIFATGFGLFIGAPHLQQVPVFRWIENRFWNANKHLQISLSPLKQIAHDPSPAERTALGLDHMPAFDFDQPFQTYTLPLRAEIMRQELSIDFETGHTDGSLTRIMDNVVPVLRLSTDTFSAQIARLDEIQAKADDFLSKFQPHSKHADAVETHAVRLRLHLREMKDDMLFTLSGLDRQKKLLAHAYSQASSAKRAEQIKYFLDYATEAEAKLIDRARTSLGNVDTAIFELNKFSLMPI